MKIHRFYVTNDQLELSKSIWVNNDTLIHQWSKVLRLKPGEQIILFDGKEEERLYSIDRIEPKAVHLSLITEMERQVPTVEVYLFFSLLKKDNNEWIIQKATELGVSNLVPILAERCERAELSQNRMDRWERIAVEAVEQCGRSDIPSIREAIHLQTALDEFSGKIDLFFAEQHAEQVAKSSEKKLPRGVFVGPEGGWTDKEKQLLAGSCQKLNLSQFTLRAETACIAACTKLLDHTD